MENALRSGGARSGGSGPGGAGRLNVLIAIADFPMLRAGFRSIIDAEPDMNVVADVSATDDLADALKRGTPDVVIAECLPLNRDGCDSFQTIKTIRTARPTAWIVAIDCRAASDGFSIALKAGADGFLTREAAPDDVVSAVRSVSRGQTYVSPAIVSRMVNTYVLGHPESNGDDPYLALNDREREVLLLAAVGHTNREIAEAIHLSEQTVHNYRATLMEKLDLHDRVDLLKYAIRRGLVNAADL
jgi:DNA-binding NarL/FixJ family response regulator